MEKIPIIGNELLTIEEVISLLGGFNVFQCLVIASLAIMSPPRVFQVVFMVFGAQNPSWTCLSNSTVCKLNGTLPSTNLQRCLIPREEWEYTESSEFSIITEYDLHCNTEWIAHLMNSIVFVGWGTGAVVLGWVADNYGRKIVIYPSQAMVVLCGFAFSYAKSVPLLIFLRFVIGFFIPAGTVQSFVLISEYVSSKHRPMASLLLFISFTASASLFCLKAYYIYSWRLLCIVCTAPYVVTVLSYFFVPESIRWIRLKGKEGQVIEVLKRIAYWNKKEMPKSIDVEVPSENVHRKYSVIDIFRTRRAALISIVLGYSWFANGMIYYSFTFAAGDLGGSIYLTVFLYAIIGIPGNISTMYLCDRIGRKKTVIISMFLASICCVAVAFIPADEDVGEIIRKVVALAGKYFIGVSFSGIYVWSVEVYPTTTRSNAMGYLQVTSRIGAASAPWVAKSLLKYHTSAPYLVMGFTSFIATFVLLYVPSTKGKVMKECDTGTRNEQPENLHLEECNEGV